MEGFLITPKGFEEIAIKEIEHILNKDSKKIFPGTITFEASHEEICELTYKAQSAKRVGMLIKNFKIKKIEDLNQEKISWPEIISEEKSIIKAECERFGEHDFQSPQVERKIGELLTNHFKDKKININLHDYTHQIYAYIDDDDCLIGMDYSGFDLSKRDYKLFQTINSLNGSIAFALTQIADYTPKKRILNPYCNDGTIAIEAALFGSKKSPNYYSKKKLLFRYMNQGAFEKLLEKWDKNISDKELEIYAYDEIQAHTKATDKNAKIIGVHKLFKVSKLEVEWLELRFKKNVDTIIGTIPSESKSIPADKAKKIAHELMYQAAYVLKKGGKIVLLEHREGFFEEEAKKEDILLIEKKEVYIGKQKMILLIFQKS